MPKRTRTIIGKVDEDIPVMQALTDRVEIKVTLNKSLSDSTVDEAGTPTVYFTAGITPESLLAVYEKLNWQPEGKVTALPISPISRF